MSILPLWVFAKCEQRHTSYLGTQQCMHNSKCMADLFKSFQTVIWMAQYQEVLKLEKTSTRMHKNLSIWLWYLIYNPLQNKHESSNAKCPFGDNYNKFNLITEMNQNMHFNIKERYKYCQLTTNKRVDPHLYKSITLSFLL